MFKKPLKASERDNFHAFVYSPKCTMLKITPRAQRRRQRGRDGPLRSIFRILRTAGDPLVAAVLPRSWFFSALTSRLSLWRNRACLRPLIQFNWTHICEPVICAVHWPCCPAQSGGRPFILPTRFCWPKSYMSFQSAANLGAKISPFSSMLFCSVIAW